MMRVVLLIIAFLLMIHGLIHLMGFAAYWPLAELAELPYKTTVLNERVDLGPGGMRLYGLLWLVTAVAFVSAAAGLVFRQEWWWPVLWLAVLLSLIVCLLDWQNAFRGAIISLVILVGLGLLLGLRIQPAALAAYPQQTPVLDTIPIPQDLPLPVARFYETIAGDQLPVIETAVLTGRGSLTFQGITFPARFRMVHRAGYDYRQFFQATYFGFPLMAADEYYIDGRATLNTPVGVVENDPKVDSAANLALWSLAINFPSILITDPRARWEAIDENRARLVVPYEDGEDSFMVSFDPQTGLITQMDAQRYRDAQSGKKAWRLEGFDWQEQHGVLLPTTWAVTWLHEGSPWLTGTIEESVLNVDVSSYLENGEEGLLREEIAPEFAH